MTSIYQLRIDLRDAKPPIWRRVLVKDTTTLGDLHEIIQTVMDWGGHHLHQFEISREYFGTPHPDDWQPMHDEEKYKLIDIISMENSTFSYLYDFGDSWEHKILVEKILPVDDKKNYPVCIKGKRACPPDDVGGIWGYYNFLDAINDPKHDSHDMYKNWLGYDFDPTEFDIKTINQRLEKYA